ncbi:DUF4124 domain-containing protein [Marinobacter sp.]|uniref:DUF4124 domain-containing protein n=1 Tax=Marinobacter sp. TaxID=50741 RepID=UPI0035630D74
MTRRLILMAAIVLLTPAMGLADSSVYRWTDENGVVHFGDREPAGGSADRVSVKTGTSSRNSDRKSFQEQVEALDERKAERDRRENESAVEEARRKQRDARCDTARANLQAINSNARIRVADADGEQRYLTPEEIQEKRAEFETIVEESCDDNPES